MNEHVTARQALEFKPASTKNRDIQLFVQSQSQFHLYSFSSYSTDVIMNLTFSV